MQLHARLGITQQPDDGDIVLSSGAAVTASGNWSWSWIRAVHSLIHVNSEAVIRNTIVPKVDSTPTEFIIHTTCLRFTIHKYQHVHKYHHSFKTFSSARPRKRLCKNLIDLEWRHTYIADGPGLVKKVVDDATTATWGRLGHTSGSFHEIRRVGDIAQWVDRGARREE